MKIIELTVGMVRTHCYIVYDDKSRRGVIIDPGADPQRLLGQLRQNQITLEYIFLTHGHFDHILAVSEIKKETGAQVVIHALDADCLLNSGRSLSPIDQQPLAPDIQVRGGEKFAAGGLDFTFMHTPGHTPGSCVILCGRTMFSGDTLFAENCGRCDLPGGSVEQMMASLQALRDLDGDYKVYPGHDDYTTLSRERDNNPYMRGDGWL